MYSFEGLYDHTEHTQVRFVGFHSDAARYDFGIVYTNLFFGKPLVVDMQTGKSVLLSSCEVLEPNVIKEAFQINNDNEAEELALFFQKNLPVLSSTESQY